LLLTLIEIAHIVVFMNLARDINNRLDRMLAIRAEIKRMMKDLPVNETLVNKQTGQKLTRDEVVEITKDEINTIKKDLNKITNNGENVNGIFTNKFYVNDFMHDKQVAKQDFINN